MQRIGGAVGVAALALAETMGNRLPRAPYTSTAAFEACGCDAA